MSHDDRLPDPARVVLKRRIEWMDTADAGPAVDGSLKACLIDRSTGRATQWPADVRALLASGGLQDAGR